MAKLNGLSRLADTASELLDATCHYPVRRRGEKRRLTPNTDGAAWLEERSWFLTEIPDLDDVLPDPDTGLIFYEAVGASQRDYSRPAFQLIVDGGFSGAKQRIKACEACDNFVYSWNCSDHPELPWDDVRGRWVRPCTDLPSCGCTPCYIERQDRTESRHRVRREAARHREDMVMPVTLVDRLFHRISESPESREARERLNSNYFAFGHEVSLPEVAADPVLREEFRRQTGLNLPHREEAMSAEHERRALLLPDFTVHLEGTFEASVLEVTGESADGTTLRIRLEGEWRDSSG